MSFSDFWDSLRESISQQRQYSKEYRDERRRLKLKSAKVYAQIDHVKHLERKRAQVRNKSALSSFTAPKSTIQPYKPKSKSMPDHSGQNPMEIDF